VAKKIRKYKQKHRSKFGYDAETYVENLLSSHGTVERSKQWHYDMLFMGRVNVEVKATQLGVIRTGFDVRRVNHGWTIYYDRHDALLKEEHGYYALVLMVDTEIICVRFLEANKAMHHLNNSMDSTGKPRIRLGALYQAMKPEQFIRECVKIIGGSDA
jgi:hypothetical protein